MVCWYIKLLGFNIVTTTPILKGEDQDREEKCPFHLGWGQFLQTWPKSNLEKICQGGGSFWHSSNLSWWALWRPFCSKEDCLQNIARRLLLTHSSSRCEEVYLPMWSMSKDGETYSKGWDAHSTSSDLSAIWEVGYGLCDSYQHSFKTEVIHHCVHRLSNKWTKTKAIKAAKEEKVVEFLREKTFYKFGYPREMVIDQGS